MNNPNKTFTDLSVTWAQKLDLKRFVLQFHAVNPKDTMTTKKSGVKSWTPSVRP